jgi:hypothetical protein
VLCRLLLALLTYPLSLVYVDEDGASGSLPRLPSDNDRVRLLLDVALNDDDDDDAALRLLACAAALPADPARDEARFPWVSRSSFSSFSTAASLLFAMLSLSKEDKSPAATLKEKTRGDRREKKKSRWV